MVKLIDFKELFIEFKTKVFIWKWL